MVGDDSRHELEDGSSDPVPDTLPPADPTPLPASEVQAALEAPSEPVDTTTSAELVDTTISAELVDTPASSEPVDTSASAEPVDTSASSEPVDTAASSEFVDATAPVSAEAPTAEERVLAADVVAARPRGDIRLFAFPDYSSTNPYQTGLYSALAANGEVSYGPIEEAVAALQTETRRVVFHLHWPEPLFAGTTDIHDYEAKASEFLSAVKLFQAGGGLFVWTIHNKLSHDRRLGDFEPTFLGRLAAAANVIHLHSEAAIAAVSEVYPIDPAKVIVVPHGSYLGYYPPGVEKARARRLLGLPEDAFVFAFAGQLRPYKGVDALLAAFEEIAKGHPKAYLIVAGKPLAPFSAASVRLLADVNPALRVITGFLSPHELSRICSAADVVVLPYREILTSGSVLLAATYGRPVIVPSTPTLDFVAKKGIGYTYDASRPDGLSGAMRAVLTAPPSGLAEAGARAEDFARKNAWTVHGESFLRQVAKALPGERVPVETDGNRRSVWVHRRSQAKPGTIGVALVNYFSVDDIERLVASLPAAAKGRDIRVYVFDNSAKRRPNRHLAEIAHVYAYGGGNHGYAGGNNILLELMRAEGCDYGFILNPDVGVSASTFEALLRHARPDAVLAPAVMNADGRVGYGGGIAFAGPDGVVVNQLFEGSPAGVLPREPYEVDVLNGCALFVPLALLPAIGHIPEDYFLYYEETHWCLGFRDRGAVCVVCPDARVTHNKRSKAGDFPALYYAYYLLRNRFIFAARWGERLGGGAYDGAAIAEAIQRDFVAPWTAKIAERNPGLQRVFARCVAAACEDGLKGVTGAVDLSTRIDEVELPEARPTNGRLEQFGGGSVRGWLVEQAETGGWVSGQAWVFRDGSPVRSLDATEARPDVEKSGFCKAAGFQAQASFAVDDGETHQFEVRARGDGRRIPFARVMAKEGPLDDRQPVTKRLPQYKLSFGSVVGGRLNGWIYDAAHPDVPVLIDIDLATGGTQPVVLAGIRADIWRPDLEKAKIGDGSHAFQAALPNSAFKQLTVEATARLAGRPLALAKRQVSIVNPTRGFNKNFGFNQFLRWSYNEERMPYGMVDEIPTILETMDLERAIRVARAQTLPEAELVSVVMPVFNREQIVAEAIRSVLDQSYRNFELIVVDDGSADASVAVVKSFDDPRLILIEQPENGGVSSARNAGLRVAKGALVAYIDSDNLWNPHYLEIMVDAFRQAPEAEAAYAGQEIWEYLPSFGRDEFRLVRLAPFNRSRLERRNFIDLNVFMHRRVLFERLGGFNESMRRLVDWELILRYTERRPPAFVPVTLGRYRIARADNQITFVEDHLANLALLRLPSPLADLRVTDDTPAPPLAVFVEARSREDFARWARANAALVADGVRLVGAWPAEGGAEAAPDPEAEGIAHPSVAAALGALCAEVDGEATVLVTRSDYVLAGRWKAAYAAARAAGHFDAMTGRLYAGTAGGDGSVTFEDQMPPKISGSILGWQFSPQIHGVTTTSLPAQYLLFPAASVPRLKACTGLKPEIADVVARFFGFASSGPVVGLYAPDLAAFAIADLPFIA